MSQRVSLLQKLNLGSSVAEFDQDLFRYFLETNTFRSLVESQVDIVSGDKGSGKTAIYRYVSDNQSTIPELGEVTILPGFNPSGSPVFKRLTEAGPLIEGQYVTVWKTYMLSLIGNWVLQIYEGSYSDDAKRLDSLLRSIGLRNPDDSTSSVFSRVAAWAKKLLSPQTVGIEIKFDHTGIPIMTPKAQYGGDADERAVEDAAEGFVSHEEALGLLDSVLRDLDAIVWLVLDRLDEAFIGYPAIEVPALRALLRTYLDLLAFSQIRMKIFVRHDLFGKIIREGFVNLSHVNARKADIIWDDDDLLALLCRRIRGGEEFLDLARRAGLADETESCLLGAVLPEYMDPAQKRQRTWRWMLAHTRDGNGCIQPRNLIDLLRFSRDEQLRREQFSSSHKVFPLLGPEALKRAFKRLSKQRVEDTIIAESSQEVAACVKGLRDGKAEHNDESLAKAFGVNTSDVKGFIEVLTEIGFLEIIEGGGYRVPMLYREGLNITQGKAFGSGKR